MLKKTDRPTNSDNKLQNRKPLTTYRNDGRAYKCSPVNLLSESNRMLRIFRQDVTFDDPFDND